MPVMKVAACASYIPTTAIFSTEIQPVRKLRKILQWQTNQISFDALNKLFD